MIGSARRNSPKSRSRRKGQRLITQGLGARIQDENITFIPAAVTLKPLRDQLIIQPMDVVHSHILIVPPHSSKLVRGKVLLAGPGHYPNYYLDAQGNKNPPKSKRAQVCHGKVFVPMPLKVGDIVHLDGRNTGKDAFDAFYYGDRYCIHARAEDVAGVEI